MSLPLLPYVYTWVTFSYQSTGVDSFSSVELPVESQLLSDTPTTCVLPPAQRLRCPCPSVAQRFCGNRRGGTCVLRDIHYRQLVNDRGGSQVSSEPDTETVGKQ